MIFLNSLLTSPLDQFEVQSIFTLTSPFLGFFTISITTFSFYALITPYLILAYHYYADNEYHLVPSRWSISVETMYASINGIVKEQLGREEYLPLIYTLFFFVLFSNLVGNIPYSYTIGTSIIASIGLSFTILVAVTILGISIHKVHFASFFVPQGTPLPLVPVLVLIELVSYLARAFSLGIRLFANTTAGHSLLAILSGFLYKLFLGNGIIVSVLTLIPFALFLCIVGLELAVSFIQAYVFTLLTTSYIKDAIDLH